MLLHISYDGLINLLEFICNHLSSFCPAESQFQNSNTRPLENSLDPQTQVWICLCFYLVKSPFIWSDFPPHLSNFVYHRTTWGTFRNATYRSSSLWRPSNLVRWRIISEWRLFASSHFDPRIEAFRTPPGNGLYLWRRIQGWNTTQNGFWTTRRRKRCGSCGCQLSCRASW